METPGPERMERRDRTLPRPIMPKWSDHRAWTLSCLAHTGLFITLALFWRPSTRGTGGEVDRPVGIALVHETNKGTEYFVAGGGSQAQAAANSAESSLTASLPDVPGLTPLNDLIADLLPNDSTPSNATSGAETVGTGLAGTGNSGSGGTGNNDFGKGPKTKTSFLGVEGSGSSFVYVLDRSDSMNVNAGTPMFVAKRELLKSIDSLGETNQFQIIFYNEAPVPLLSLRGIGNRLLFATETDRNRAKQFVRGMIANGGTEHMAALRAGLSYGPDVLFFMTDADEPRLNDAQLQIIRELAARSPTTIHTIQFRAGPQQGEGGWIRTLAEMTKGTYRYVNVEDLAIEK